jgi:hypothetical protein
LCNAEFLFKTFFISGVEGIRFLGRKKKIEKARRWRRIQIKNELI